MKRALKVVALLCLLAFVGASYWLFTTNNYQTSGDLSLSILDAPVTVRRDQLNIPYIQAESLADALRAQGFITGQDRLYQAQLYRLLALGRLSEVVGERGLKNDTLIRVMGITQLAEQQLKALDQPARDFFQHYIQGLNAYIAERRSEHPLSVRMLGIAPEPWTLQDIIAIQLFQTWSNGSNWRMDLLSLQIIDTFGTERAQQIAQITINPDDNSVVSASLNQALSSNPRPSNPLTVTKELNDFSKLEIKIDPEFTALLPNALQSGSNAWATGSEKSTTGAPILASSPHLPATTLPGFWHPMGLFTPTLNAVGVAAPGSPGIGVGRTQNIAYGATVGGSDGADLYIEQLDPTQSDHYLEGGVSIPLSLRTETITVKDKEADGGYRQQEIVVRSSKRGPLISDHGISLKKDRAISLRWAVAGSHKASMGSDRLLVSKNLDEARSALSFSPTALSYVVVDKEGGIGRISSGRVPIRTAGDGAKPLSIDSLIEFDFDNWNGLIPTERMPVELRPVKDWVGTANHRIIKQNYPYQYSKIFAASWRYRRIKQFMENSQKLSVDDHWQLINDIENPMAKKLAPFFARFLSNQPDTKALAMALEDWDYRDDIDSIAPSLFHSINRNLVRLTFQDDMPEPLWLEFYDAVYFWQERLVLMLHQPNSPWFDIVGTEQIEQRDDIVLKAIEASIDELTGKLGPNSEQWQWGKLHTITFASPVIPGKRAARWLGAGTHPMFGSGETLNRGRYKMTDAYNTTVIDSVRLVVDMADQEKILAVLPGGVSGRYFDKSLSNQSDDWLAGKANRIWFNLEKVEENAMSTLTLSP